MSCDEPTHAGMAPVYGVQWEYTKPTAGIPQAPRVILCDTLDAARTLRDNPASWGPLPVDRTVVTRSEGEWVPVIDPSEPCGRGPCAAPDGHAGTCSEASGWELDDHGAAGFCAHTTWPTICDACGRDDLDVDAAGWCSACRRPEGDLP